MDVRELELSTKGQIQKQGCSRRESMSQGQEEEERVYFSRESSLAGEESKWTGSCKGKRRPGPGCRDCQIGDFPLNYEQNEVLKAVPGID